MQQCNNLIVFFKFLSVILFGIITFSFFPINLVFAQAISTSLTPSLTELAIKPGRTADLNFKLTNKGDPSIYKLSIEPLEASKDNSIYFDLLNQDLRLNDSVFLKNGSIVDLRIRVFIPEGTPQQDHYFSVVAQSQPSPVQEGLANIRAKITLKSLLLITVTNDGQLEIKPKISLMEVISRNRFDLFGLRLNIFDSYQPIPVVLLVDNQGKNLIKPAGEIIVKGPLWQVNNQPLSNHTVLANSQRRLEFNLPGRFVGNYRVSAHFNFGQGSPTAYASSSFLVIPFKFSIFMITLTIFIVFILPKIKKRLIH